VSVKTPTDTDRHEQTRTDTNDTDVTAPIVTGVLAGAVRASASGPYFA
jgi:hypothetical protein